MNDNQQVVVGGVFFVLWCAAFALLMVLGLGGCAPQGRAMYDYENARDAYVACAKANGAAACTAERDVMNAAAGVAGMAAGRPQVQSPNMTVGVYR